MPDDVDTPVHPMKMSRRDTAFDRILATPQAAKLTDREHSMLSCGNLGYAGVDLGELLAQYTG
jgi:hypothetical protein